MAKGHYRHNTHTITLRSERYATGHNANLAKECFAEVSRQVVEYMKLHSIHPHNSSHGTNTVNTLDHELEERRSYRKHKGFTNLHREAALYKSYSADALHAAGMKRNSGTEMRTTARELHFALPTTHLQKVSSGPSCPTCGSSISLFTE